MTEFGIQLPDLSDVAPEQRFARAAELAESAESSGFGSVWVVDHHIGLPAAREPEPPPLEAYTLLGALAARTSRVRLGALVGDLSSRPPGIVAKLATSLDVIAYGRTALGFGASDFGTSDRSDLGAGGRLRLGALDETLQICRAMFVGDDVSFDGDHFRLEHARNHPQPSRPGGPRILITGSDDGRILSLVARYADVCGVTGTARALARTIELLERSCQQIGRDRAEIDVAWLAPCVLTTSDQHSREVRASLGGDRDQPPGSGLLVGQPHELPLLVAGHVHAGADEVIFDFAGAGAGPPAIVAAGGALGLTTTARPASEKDDPRCH
jgi:alkanesulfonate monooxygenase SsuD/methylene tetrahydromethanopterin reductase-like flavin-dependent oxidoreductase (luciferase family)